MIINIKNIFYRLAIHKFRQLIFHDLIKELRVPLQPDVTSSPTKSAKRISKQPRNQ